MVERCEEISREGIAAAFGDAPLHWTSPDDPEIPESLRGSTDKKICGAIIKPVLTVRCGSWAAALIMTAESYARKLEDKRLNRNKRERRVAQAMGLNDSNEAERERPSTDAGGEAQAKSGMVPWWGKYALGAGLVLGICVLIGGSKFSNDFGTIIKTGLVAGPFFFLFLGQAHFALQLLARRVSNRLWRPGTLIEGMILNLPASVICRSLPR